MSSDTRQIRRPMATKRKLVFTACAFCLALLPIAILELSLSLFGWNDATERLNEVHDPFIGFNGDQSLFEKHPSGKSFRIRESRLGYFRPASFLAEKPENGYRVFVVGGSTVQGRPWETETAFAKWLELAISACEPDRKVEVINCGGVSYASYRLSLIVDEIAGYSPDLIVLCTGHNEFLEQRTYPKETHIPAVVLSLHQALSNLKSYRWLRSSLIRGRSQNSEAQILDDQVITKLDYENGLARFTKQNLQREMVARHFRFNLRKMLQTILSRKVNVIVAVPPANQKDCPPFKPVADWSPDDRSRFEGMQDDEFETVPSVDRSADYYFHRGQLNLSSGRLDAARQDFDQAIELDICPLRMTEQLRQATLREVKAILSSSKDGHLLYIDLHQKCRSVSKQGIVGNDLLVDHVHPSIGTHQQIARWLLELLHTSRIVHKPPGWEDRLNASIDTHIKSLGFGYFQRGKDRLESVLRWSRGKARKPFN